MCVCHHAHNDNISHLNIHSFNFRISGIILENRESLHLAKFPAVWYITCHSNNIFCIYTHAVITCITYCIYRYTTVIVKPRSKLHSVHYYIFQAFTELSQSTKSRMSSLLTTLPRETQSTVSTLHQLFCRPKLKVKHRFTFVF